MQDFFGLPQRGVGRPGAVALVAILALLSVAVPTSGQSINGTANGTASGPVGEGQVVPCQQVKENPAGDPAAPYRIVTGSCAIDVADGEVLSRVWFRADGGRVDINARGSGWTIRNIAITGHAPVEDPPLNLRVQSREGVGVLSNLWVSDIDSNALFVHSSHAGTIRFNGVTFLRTGEDAAYSSRPGNPDKGHVDQGAGGIVGYRQVYVKKAGLDGEGNPKAGYGLRLGTDGSYIIDSTIVSATGPATANTFAGGQHPNQYPGSFDGVLLRNVDIVTPGIGLRLNNHQGGLKGGREWTSITTLQNVRIEAGQPIDRNQAGGEDPIIRGDYGTNADPSPPPGAPRSPERAASGVGGGTGSIGGPAGTGSIVPLSEIASVVSLVVFGFVAVLVVLAIGIIALIERDGDGDGDSGGLL